MDEIIEILEERYRPAEIVEILKCITKFDIEEYALTHDVCPLCCGELFVRRYKEYRGEYFGFPSWEEMCDLVCSRCGEVW